MLGSICLPVVDELYPICYNVMLKLFDFIFLRRESMKKTFLFTVIVMMRLMIVSAVCADDLSDVKQAGVLRFGAPLEYIPFVYQDENDKSQCINIEIIQNGLANITNYKIEEGNPSIEFDAMLKADRKSVV